MEGLKTYRHDNNPLEKKIHDIFVKEYAESKNGVAMEQIVMPIDGNGNPEEYLTDREKQIMITTIQWLGSPVGQGFLENCGFTLGKK